VVLGLEVDHYYQEQVS